MNYRAYEFGPLARRLKEQGITWLSAKDLDRFQFMLDGLYSMMMQRLVTDKEYDRILERTWKLMLKCRKEPAE